MHTYTYLTSDINVHTHTWVNRQANLKIHTYTHIHVKKMSKCHPEPKMVVQR